jgi:mannose-6-phosphate isomerase-like protein (cupin superfamily)
MTPDAKAARIASVPVEGREEAFGLDEKHGRSFVGRASDAAKDRGWFFGHFMDEPLLQSDAVEVAWQHVPNLTPSADQRHIHRRSVEINVVLRGEVSLKLDEVQHDLREGDFYVVWPESVVSEIATDGLAEVLVVRAPSVPEDKFLLP